MKLVLERQIQLAFIFALLVLLTVVFFGYRSAVSMSEALKWEKHTQEVLLKLNDTMALSTEAEIGGRGFIITGNENFLLPFQNSAPRMSQNFADMHELIVDNPSQTAELDNLEKAINEKSAFGKTLVGLRRNGKLDEARNLIDSGQGMRIMEAIQSSGGKMRDEELRLLRKREDDLDSSIANTLFFLFFGTGAGIVSLALANWAIFREAGKRRLAQEQLRGTNKDLEQRVEDRTRELTVKNEELNEQIKQRELSENRRRIALEAGRLGTWTVDPKTNRAEVDELSLSLFGLTGEEFDGSSEKAFSHIHAEDFPLIEQLFQKSVSGHGNFNAEFRVIMPDGAVRWNHCIGQPQLDENGEITHIVGHCRDVTENKESEFILRESELFNRTILDSLSAHIAVINKEGIITAVNEAWQTFAQANCLEHQIGTTGVGQNYLKVCESAEAFEKDTKQVLENLRAVLAGEITVFAVEYPCHSADEERWFILQVSAMRGARGGAVVSHINITDRKTAEQALQIQEENFRALIQASSQAVWTADDNGQGQATLDWWSELTGQTIAESGGWGWLEALHSDDRSQAREAWEYAFKTRTPFDAEYRVLERDGETYRHFAVGGVPVFNSDGSFRQWIGTLTDISARKAAENELKNSEEFNRSIFENSPDCVKVLEIDGTLNSMNTNGLCIMEIDDFSGFAGKQWIDFWEGDENELAYQAIQTAGRGETAHFEGFCRTAKGNLKYWDVTVAPVFDINGNPSRFISTSRDISKRREAEREREELLRREQAARKDAEIANRMRDEFLATVSHELRAPLNSILGWGRLMEKGKLDEVTTEKAVHTIVRNAESQNRLIEDLLDVSRIISGKLRLEVITLKPINVVESALETVRPAAEAKGIKLEVKENFDVSHIAGDPNRLQQVIWNLLSNAIKFTPNGGEVSVGIQRNEDYTEIKVTDTGVGIKEEFLPHVFDRFRQADTSSIRKFGGLGLGLAIVRHITEMHGGTVKVESSGENKGSTFTIRLPLIPSLPEEKESELVDETARKIKEPTQKFKLDGLLILVVDDEQDTRQLLVQALTFHGATIETATSAEEALRAIEAKNPDILVSDIGMPNEDGYSLIRKVRALPDAQHKNIPAIALTAFTRAQDRMRALASGYQTHVAKPIEPDELATVIASLTGRLKMDED